MGTWWVLTNIYFKGLFSFNAVASLDYISLQAETNLNKEVGGGARQFFFSITVKITFFQMG